MNHIRYILFFLYVSTFFSSESKEFDVHYYIQAPEEILTYSSAYELSEYVLNESNEPLKLGYQKGPVWVKIEIPKNQDISYFEVTNPRFKEISYYLFEKDILVKNITTGVLFPPDSRELKSPFFFFKVSGDNSKNRTVLLRLESDDGFVTNFKFFDEKGIYPAIANELIIGFFSLGVIVSLSILYFKIFISLKEKGYLFYSIYSFTAIFSILKVNGFLTFYLFPEIPWLNNYSAIIETTVAFTAGLFSIHFLKLKKFTPSINKLVWVLVLNSIVATFVSLIGFNSLAIQIIETGALLFIIVIIPTSAYIFSKFNSRPAKYYLISFSFLAIGSALYIANNYGLFSSDNLFLKNSLELGVSIEMIFLAIGVAKRIDLLRFKLIQSQEENLKIISNQKEELEQKVKEKTSELQSQNDQLRNALEDLRNAQSKLIESEKLATLGFLSSGIAHELNNPINFINGCAHSLNKNLVELQEVQKLADDFLNKYDKEKSNGDLIKLSNEIDRRKEEIDYEFLLKETEELIKNIQTGSKRTSRILDHLKYFTKDSQKNLSEILFEDNLEAIMSILKSEIWDRSIFEFNFDKDLSIHCIPAKFNQALINNILNSLQAIDSDNGKIKIDAKSKGEYVEINITDNGLGIDPNVVTEIFEPFFTTRPNHVGLGLSLAAKAIMEHNGEIKASNIDPSGLNIKIIIPA